MNKFYGAMAGFGVSLLLGLGACGADDDDETGDRRPPSISVMGISEGAVVSGLVNVDVTATDESGIAEIRFFVDDALVGTEHSSPFTFQWDTNDLAPGSSHVIRIEATDGVGNTGTSGNIAVTIQEGQSDSGGCWVLSTLVGSTLSKYDSRGELLQQIDVTAQVGERVGILKCSPSDGAFWLGTTDGNLYHLNHDLEVDASLNLGGGIHAMDRGTDVYESDGSLYVAVTGQQKLMRIVADGTTRMEVPGYDNIEYLGVDQNDGAVWFTFLRDWADHIGKLSAAGELVVDIAVDDQGGYMSPYPLAVSPIDGSVWFACECYHCTGHENGHLVGLDGGGTELFHLSLGNIYGSAYADTFVDAAGNPWYNDVVDEKFVKISSSGEELARVALADVNGFASLSDASAHWVFSTFSAGSTVRKLDSNGVEILSFDAGGSIDGVCAIP